MEQYTKGEWYAEEDFMEEISILSIPDGEDFPTTVATIRECGKYDGTEMLANARLIAAAPDLYEACQYAEAFCEAVGEGLVPIATRDMVADTIKQALAKVEDK